MQPWGKFLEKNWSDITRESKNVMKLPMFAVWYLLKWGPVPPKNLKKGTYCS